MCYNIPGIQSGNSFFLCAGEWYKYVPFLFSFLVLSCLLKKHIHKWETVYIRNLEMKWRERYLWKETNLEDKKQSGQKRREGKA